MEDVRADGASRPPFGVRWLIAPPSEVRAGAGTGIDVKPGARIGALTPAVREAFPQIVDAFRDNSAPTPVITSGNDSRHKRGSRHYTNDAIDLRCNHLPDEHCERITGALKKGLGPDFDVIFERFPKQPSNDHIHIEHDPKSQSKPQSRGAGALGDQLAIGDWMTRRNQQSGG